MINIVFANKNPGYILLTSNSAENSIYRVLDASINRAGEGIRVVEDFVRLQLNDSHLARQLKQLRHDLTDAVKRIDPSERIASRDSEGDVGRTIEVESEYQRDSTARPGCAPDFSGGMIQANMARAQQAFRTIEEFSKTIDEGVAKAVEQLRYRTYTLEKAVLTTVVSRQNLSESNLYVLIDACGCNPGVSDSTGGDRLNEVIQQLVRSDVSLIQLRDKSLSDRQTVVVGRMISSLTHGTSTRFVMNDRADLAVAAFADGVHLGQDDLHVADARRILGAARMIGVSTHSIEQARQAVLDGANYIGVGPVFPSTTKQFESHVGLELLQQVAAEIQLPAFAIGGVSLANVGSVMTQGMQRVAIGAAIAGEEHPGDVATEFKQLLRRP